LDWENKKPDLGESGSAADGFFKERLGRFCAMRFAIEAEPVVSTRRVYPRP
jgi:hypothetical protein